MSFLCKLFSMPSSYTLTVPGFYINFMTLIDKTNYVILNIPYTFIQKVSLIARKNRAKLFKKNLYY
jgi:ABC-type multidrug transport system permease subunit